MYNEFMRLKSKEAVLHWHHFITSDMFVMRGSCFLLMSKAISDNDIRKSLHTMLATQQPCASCNCELKPCIPRSRCKHCLVSLCETCVEERMEDNYWCGHCNSHMFYYKVAKPIVNDQLKRLNAFISNKLTHDI